MSANEVLITARNPILRQRPGRMLARTAAAEVVARQQNLARLRLGLVQDEIRLRLALGIVAPVAEKLIAQPVLRNGLQKSRRDDLIGIDVVDRASSTMRLSNGVNVFHYSKLPHVGDHAGDAPSGGGQRAGQERARRPCPAVLRNCDCWSTRCTRPAATDRHSSRCTWSSRPRANRRPRRGKSRSSPSACACAFTCCDPGTTITRTFGLHLAALQHAGRGAQIGDARIGAASDEHHVDGMPQQRLARRQIHIAQRLRQRIALQRIGDVARIRAPRR